MILINPKLSRSTVPFLIPLPTKQLRLIITRSLSRQKPVLLFLFCGSMVCGEFILTAFLICVTNYQYTSFQMINTSAVNTYGFLPDSMMLLIHSLIQSILSAECMWITGISAREYHWSYPRFQQSCPRFLWSHLQSHRFDYGCWTYVYDPSSCPTIFQSIFSAISRFFVFLPVMKVDVFMPEHTVQFIGLFIPMTKPTTNRC